MRSIMVYSITVILILIRNLYGAPNTAGLRLIIKYCDARYDETQPTMIYATLFSNMTRNGVISLNYP